MIDLQYIKKNNLEIICLKKKRLLNLPKSQNITFLSYFNSKFIFLKSFYLSIINKNNKAHK